jgi:pyruvate,orthophosphate dikinase
VESFTGDPMLATAPAARIVFPEITEMQARAIFQAACEVKKKGTNVKPEVMIPLVGNINELKLQKAIVEDVANEILKKNKVKIDYMIGTMIEIPRAAITADEIAEEAQFSPSGRTTSLS